MKKKVLYWFAISLILGLTLPIGNASAQLKVLTVPFLSSNPLTPHDTYNGVSTTFMAIARGGTGSYDFDWDFNGDGVFDFSSTTTNPYDLSTTFTYPVQASDRLFIAKIRVTSGSETATAEYRVLIHEPAVRDVKVNHAIDNALWFLHVNMNRYTDGGVAYGNYSSQTLAAAGMAAQAFEIQGYKANGDYDTNPYVEDVRRTLNYCLNRTVTVPVSSQPAGDPDANGNGIGLMSSLQSPLYETGIVLMALANCGDPSIIAELGLPNSDIAGRTYKDIVQDMVDLLAFAQNENSVWRGGWRYSPNYSQSDMSVTQWPVIGLEAAEKNPDFSGLITVPGWVKTELRDNFLTYIQGADGGFGYVSPGSNFPRTGAGLACQAWVGLPDTDPKVLSAINYLGNTWSLTGYDGNIGNFYSMYGVNKGMRGFDPDIEAIGSHDWYAEYADWLIAQQAGDGGWSDCCYFAGSRNMATASGILILVKEIIEPPPVAMAKASPKEAPPGTIITFDHSGSYHLSPSITLSKFRWDFDNDGIWDYETDDLYAKPTWVYNDIIGCGDEVIHPVNLEVEDAEGKTDQDRESVIIKINLFNHPPVAIGDPTPSDPNYAVSKGGMVFLDASPSYDPDTDAPLKCDPSAPDDFITKYEWDLDNDGAFDAEGKTFLFHTPDQWEVGTTHTVQLRVTDDGTWAGSDGGGSKSAEATVTILVIANQTPDCIDAYASPDCLWPPNNKMVPVNILGVYDPDGDPLLIITTSITSDEATATEKGAGGRNAAPDALGIGTSQAMIRVERSGIGDGRVYVINFTAEDDKGGMCSGSVVVKVPHDQLDKTCPALDSGQNYDATAIN